MRVISYDNISSTMEMAAALASETPDDNFCVIARSQSFGMGTEDRVWESPVGNFYATFCMKGIKLQKSSITKISILSGVSVVQTVAEYGFDIQLKWSNDLMINNHKVGGILCMIYEDMTFVGVGINFKTSPTVADVNFPIGCIDPQANVNYHDFAVSLGKRIQENIDLYREKGFDDFMAFWHDHNAFMNRLITIKLPHGSVFSAIDKGIDDQGSLLIDKQGIIRSLFSAQIIGVQ